MKDDPNKRPYKMCIFCSHCTFEEGYHYSEQTWQDPYVRCNLWSQTKHGEAPGTQREFIQWNMKAKTCPLFKVLDD